MNANPTFLPSGANSRPVEILSRGERIVGLLVLPANVPAPVVVVSHGAGESKENYFEMAQALASAGFASLLLDMHGHGESAGRRYHVQIDEWTSDLEGALDLISQMPELDSSRIGAFGLSSGGTAILESATHEKRWKALVGLDATVMNTLPLRITMLIKLLGWLGWLKLKVTGKDLRVSILSLLDEVSLASDPQINERLKSDPGKLHALANFPLPGASAAFLVDTIQRVHLVQAPTLVIWGEDDELDPVSTAEALFDKLTCNKELVIIPSNGHAGHLDRNRDQVFAAAIEWLKKHLS